MILFTSSGALNTCAELDNAIEELSKVLKPNGMIVATFVNKWYAFEILWNLATLRPSKAFSRLKKIWGGFTYSLFVKCYSATQIHRIFRKHLKEISVGLLYYYPAWYRHHWAPEGGLGVNSFTKSIQYFK